MTERMMITKLIRVTETRADLFTKGRKWPDLKLFDISDLLDVGIDPTILELHKEAPCRFWAHWELSEKLNSEGNPYKNVVALEAIDKPATSTSTDNSAILTELRAIKTLLLQLVPADVGQTNGIPKTPAAEPPEQPEPKPQSAPLRYLDTTAVENGAERESFLHYVMDRHKPPASLVALRKWYMSKNAAPVPSPGKAGGEHKTEEGKRNATKIE